MLDEQCEVLAADFRRYYGVSLGAVATGDVSFVEAEALIRQLPMESAYKTVLRNMYDDEELAEMSQLNDDVEHGSWSRGDLLAATLIDAIQVLTNVQLARAGVETKPIEPVRRPGVVTKTRKQNPQAVAYLEAIRRRHQEARDAEGGQQP